MDRVGDRSGLGEQFGFQQAIMLGDLRFEDFFLWHGAEIAGQTEFVENPDRPLGGIVLPRFDTIPVVILELVVEVVVALAEGENRHEEAVARRAVGGIRTVADPVTERVDAKGGMVHEHDTGEAGEQERAEGGIGATVDVADDRRQAEAHENGDRHIIFVLPPGETVFLQIPHPCERRVRAAAEEKPADVGMEKPARDVIGVVIVVHEFVVAAVVGRPSKSGTFKCRRTEEQGVKFHQRIRLEGKVREQAVVAERDAHACGKSEEEKQSHLEEIEAVLPDIKRNGRAGDEECSNEEDAVCDSNFAENIFHEADVTRPKWKAS